MSESETVTGDNRFKCPECGNRFTRDSEVCPCGFCSTVCGPPNQIDPVPDNSVRVYCRDCDFEVDIDKDSVYFPLKLAKGRSQLHESQGHHSTRIVGSGGVSGVNDRGMELCDTVDSEEELQQWLESFFEENGWTAIREVSPHKSNYKADLIVNHHDYGWIGIETKYFEGDGGAKVAEAHHQLTRKYRSEKYINNKIDLWAFCPYFTAYNSDSRLHSREQQIRGQFSRELFSKHGVGYIDLDRREMLIDFAYSQPIAKIPVDGDASDRYYENVDIHEIKKSVSRKMEKYDYK